MMKHPKVIDVTPDGSELVVVEKYSLKYMVYLCGYLARKVIRKVRRKCRG